MSYGTLRKARIFISLFFFLLITFIFLDISNVFPTGFIRDILYLQFVPSLICFLGVISIGAAGFIVILLITILFGRIYCSFLCPLGTFQDVLIGLRSQFIWKGSAKKPQFRYRKPLNWIRYPILGINLLAFIPGYIIIINLFDPYSTYGKIISKLLRPLYIGLHNGMTYFFERFDIYNFHPVRLNGPVWTAFGFAILVLSILIWMTFKKGRLYCNSVCPVGSLLALVSKISIYRIHLDETKCTKCGRCAAVCKAGCIDIRKKNVDFSRCVGCLNCLTPCLDDAIHFAPVWTKIQNSGNVTDFDKRKFLKESALLIGGTLLLPKIIKAQIEAPKEIIPGTASVNRKIPVTPPGSIGLKHFNEKCTACYICVSQCPTQVLQPSLFQYGLKGLFQPRMDYIKSYCNYECKICGEICPTGAINPMTLDEKKLTQLGQSKFVKEDCIVYTRKTDCGACSEHCPTKAVNMVPYLEKLTIPEVDNTICVGCGACEYACPTDPKAIYVEGNPLHKTAEKPKTDQVQKKVDLKEQFPF